MRFLKAFFLAALASGILYYSILLMTIDAPIQAEYWVAEMIAIKKDLVRQYAGRKKIIVAGGSSTLFGVDAAFASKQLGLPVVNFGLHAGLRLDEILRETASVAEPGDAVILPLEPPYYEPHLGWTSWQVGNVIGWDHATWKALSPREKARFVFSISPAVFAQMCVAKVQEKFQPAAVNSHLDALDDAEVIARFRARPAPTAFQYSAYNLDNYGDILRTDGTKFKGKRWLPLKPDHVSTDAATRLKEFTASMKARGVRVFFANTPLLGSKDCLDSLRKSEAGFLGEFAPIGPMIDRREDLLFDRKYFFNTDLHLNTEGRSIRTELLIEAIRKYIVPGDVARTQDGQ